ncbi:hypothetical protein BL253_10640 [Pseudofrankia asymbiotica]|uniref:Uncharacterized protein n=1 Tax=Pseudofrankia asymbiotica TaxID=1834516 RepID=A0A1V2IF60_9ACTN|nr:hypothetical protein [Pseudofrankia asymbiotica]ONH31106.1 hypothetical protein BL253_10640 [Pseudofrankia asymbiotica]
MARRDLVGEFQSVLVVSPLADIAEAVLGDQEGRQSAVGPDAGANRAYTRFAGGPDRQRLQRGPRIAASPMPRIDGVANLDRSPAARRPVIAGLPDGEFVTWIQITPVTQVGLSGSS